MPVDVISERGWSSDLSCPETPRNSPTRYDGLHINYTLLLNICFSYMGQIMKCSSIFLNPASGHTQSLFYLLPFSSDAVSASEGGFIGPQLMSCYLLLSLIDSSLDLHWSGISPSLRYASRSWVFVPENMLVALVGVHSFSVSVVTTEKP